MVSVSYIDSTKQNCLSITWVDMHHCISDNYIYTLHHCIIHWKTKVIMMPTLSSLAQPAMTKLVPVKQINHQTLKLVENFHHLNTFSLCNVYTISDQHNKISISLIDSCTFYAFQTANIFQDNIQLKNIPANVTWFNTIQHFIFLVLSQNVCCDLKLPSPQSMWLWLSIIKKRLGQFTPWLHLGNTHNRGGTINLDIVLKNFDKIRINYVIRELSM